MTRTFTPGLWIALWALLLASGAALAQPAPAAPATSGASAAEAMAAPAEPAFTAGDDRQGTFKTVQGTIVRWHDGQPAQATVGDALWEGDRVVSGPQSAAAITLRDGTILSIGPDSSVSLAQFQFEPTTHEGNVLIALAKGSLRLVTGLIAKLRPEQVKVSTPTTVIGVRGTDFIVEQN
ncbi:MAG: FecR family protein [Burkholderiaceae bacterium]